MSKKEKRIVIILAAIVLILSVIALIIPDRSEAVKPVAETPTPTPEIQVVELTVKLPECTPLPVPMPLPDETTEPTVEPTEEPTVTPAPDSGSKNTTVKNGTAFTLTIDGSDISVAYGVEESSLETMPGWLTTSAAPGEEGFCVVYGHRNRKHLKVLEDVDFGDTITVTMTDGNVYSYRIESIEILESETDLKVPTLAGEHIMLTTCYPFHYTGHAPKKYVVIAGR